MLFTHLHIYTFNHLHIYTFNHLHIYTSHVGLEGFHRNSGLWFTYGNCPDPPPHFHCVKGSGILKTFLSVNRSFSGLRKVTWTFFMISEWNFRIIPFLKCHSTLNPTISSVSVLQITAVHT